MAKSSVTIDWSSEESHFLINPRLPKSLLDRLELLKHELPVSPGRVWLLTSGSSGHYQFKLVALSKKALLASARSVNQHLSSTEQDTWLNVLPNFHVGGLSVEARAYLSGARVVSCDNFKWQPNEFVKRLKADRITLTSLVPTQVYDLVQMGVSCPDQVRAIFVGGGAMSPDLYFRARKLDYPLLPTYGMTELGSQIATASIMTLKNFDFPNASALSHVGLRISDEGEIEVKSEALADGVVLIGEDDWRYLEFPKGGWFKTGDLGRLQGEFLFVEGRRSEVFKVKGELVSLPRLREIFRSQFVRPSDRNIEFLALPEVRSGGVVGAVCTLDGLETKLLDKVGLFNKAVAPFERVRQLYFVDQLPRTELGKLQTGELKKLLGFSL